MSARAHSLAHQLTVFMITMLGAAFALAATLLIVAPKPVAPYLSLEETSARLARTYARLQSQPMSAWPEIARQESDEAIAFSLVRSPPHAALGVRGRLDLRHDFADALNISPNDVAVRSVLPATPAAPQFPGAQLPPDVEIYLRLNNSYWLNSSAPLVSPLALGASILALFYLTGALAIAVAAFVFARRISAPLAQLARAAGKLNSAPLPTRPGAPREIAELTEAFNMARARINRHLDERAWFVAGLAHDLRSPLQRLKLRLETEDVRAREGFDLDLAQIESLLAQALAYSRDEDRGRAARGFVDLANLCAQISAERADLGLAVRFAGSAPAIVIGDALALRRVLENLVDNALIHAGGAELALESDDKAWQVIVANRNAGAPPSRLSASGSSLGLKIAREIASLHGGEVSLQTGPLGTCALLSLPRERTLTAGD